MLKVRKFFFVSLMFHLLFTFVHTGFVLSVYSGQGSNGNTLSGKMY